MIQNSEPEVTFSALLFSTVVVVAVVVVDLLQSSELVKVRI